MADRRPLLTPAPSGLASAAVAGPDRPIAPVGPARADLATGPTAGAAAGRPTPPGGPPARELPPHELLVRHALEISRLTVTRMAEELGIPRATLEAYRLGTRRMPAPARLRLAAYLSQHADGLKLVAQALARTE